MPTGLEPILPHVGPFLLVMFRLSGIFVFGPMFGSRLIPMQLKALLVVVLAFCTYPLVPAQAVSFESLPAMAFAVGSELLIGIIIGFGATLPLFALQLAGLIMGQQLGLGLARVFNPDLEEETEVVGQLLFLLALTVFIAANGHHLMLAVLVRSFHSVPLGGYMPDSGLVVLMTGLLTSMFDLALRIAAPVLCLLFLETAAMGFIARTVQHLNILSLGFPLRILLGMGLLVAVVIHLAPAMLEAFRETMTALMRLFG